MEQAIALRVKQALDEMIFPGCVVGVVTRQGARFVRAFGKQSYSTDGRSMQSDAVFDVASVTKAIPLATVTLALVERGIIGLDNPVVSFLQSFDTSPQKRRVTLRHLLTNTVDLSLPALSSMKYSVPSVIVRNVCAAPLVASPGSVYRYTNATAVLLSLCLMNVTQRSLGSLARTLFFNPLCMWSSTFDVQKPKIAQKRIVPTEVDPWRKREICGEVHDESTYLLQQCYGKNGIGSAGLFSTVPDLLTFVQMLLNGGRLGGHTYFSETMVTAMHTNHFPQAIGSGGLGFALYPQDYMGKKGTASMFGKTGFTGCMVVLDRSKERGLVVLSNYHYPHRKTDLGQNRQFRADICDIVFS